MSNGELFDWGFSRVSRTDRTDRTDLKMRVAEMKAALRERRVVHAGEFEARFGWSDRVCRQIAAASDGEILGTSEGYCLTIRATAEEFRQANSRIYSQGKKMLRRALREQRVWHRQVHA
jgi:hypothetical protein